MGWLHNWLGLLLGWLLFVIFVTGSFGYYRHEVTLMMTPELHDLAAVQVPQVDAAQRGVEWLSANASGAEEWGILLPDEKSPALRVSWSGLTPGEQILDPRTGHPLAVAPRQTGGGDFLYRIHSDLHFISPIAGRILASLIAVALLVLLITGLITHRHIVRNMFRFRRGKGWRTRLDVHNLTAVLGLPFHLFITLTALVTVMMLVMPWGVASVYGANGIGAFAEESFPQVTVKGRVEQGSTPELAPLIGRALQHWRTDSVGEINIEHPGAHGSRITLAHPIRGIAQFRKPSMTFDAADGRLLGTTNDQLSTVSLLHSQLFGLHVGHFAGPTFRFALSWLGLVGAAMVATGHLLWTAKRWRINANVAGPPQQRPAVLIVHRLNAAVFAGLPLAIAAYFWANRIIPASTAERPVLEQNAMFIVWGAAAALALLAPARFVWRTLLYLGGGALLTLGILNLSTGPGNLIMAMNLCILGAASIGTALRLTR